MRKILGFCGLICVVFGMAPVFSVSAATAANQQIQQSPRAATQQAAARNATPAAREAVRGTATRTTATSVSARSASPQVAVRSAVNTPARDSSAAIRSAPTNARAAAASPARAPVAARATIAPTGASMSGEYNTCRDAYFTCMDQFCAGASDTYRRCICSSRLNGLREMERKVAQTKESLQNFADYNIDAVSKTAKEVAASLRATEGESTLAKDKSESAQKLAGISAVLGTTKAQSLSTAGRTDIAGDIGAIWSTPDFIGGADIASMEGEHLYNLVHGQCMEMVAGYCPRSATLNMVVSAYGMYIEQDCNTVSAAIAGKKTTAAAAVRASGREMDIARLENYNAHNSTAINECIAQVRKDITSDISCGKNYVHCLDVTGLYLDYNTGEPIYSPDFFKLESQLSLDGDILTLNVNQLLVTKLNNQKSAAERGLDTCRDIADDVWQEFKRQAIIEIYQTQQARVKQVRDECMSAVNQCYDEKTEQLRNFANMDEQLIIGQSIGTADALCRDKIETCAYIFGGGPPGLEALLTFVRDVGSSKIFENCEESLDKYIREVCAVTNDLAHSYPYSCRVRNPGSYDCYLRGGCPEQAGSVFELLANYARENCVRADLGEPLPANIMGAVNRVFDAILYEMRTVLKSECERYSGEWLDVVGSKSNIRLYIDLVAASDGWGVCVAPYCVIQGDAWLDDKGVKQCCKPNEIANENNPPDGCMEITCPATSGGSVKALVDTVKCRYPGDVKTDAPPEGMGGCIWSTFVSTGSEENRAYCKCPANSFGIPQNYEDNSVDRGRCWPCDANAEWSTICTGQGLPEGNNCAAKYCKCKTGFNACYGTCIGAGAACMGTGTGTGSTTTTTTTTTTTPGG
ncbi:MAG: hypothetical protein FWF97_03585 [Alphaproteobacteria bacterium]|nr:hypothetical protein [Alphaproteobacteria bacterium]